MDRGPVKVVETSNVTDAELERIIGEAVRDGWVLDGMHFAMRESSRRPAMAFLLFHDPEYERRAAARGARATKPDA
jgi:hypothetical protein